MPDMPRKARSEGARHTRHEFVQPAMLYTPAKEPEQKLANPVPGDDGEALDRIAASFRQRFPDEWAAMAKCPLESCLPEMAKVLKGNG